MQAQGTVVKGSELTPSDSLSDWKESGCLPSTSELGMVSGGGTPAHIASSLQGGSYASLMEPHKESQEHSTGVHWGISGTQDP